MKNRPILVTGIPRSGTTWIGKMVAQSSQICYINEPLNTYFTLGTCRSVVRTWFPYITENADIQYDYVFNRVMKYKLNLYKEIKYMSSLWHAINSFSHLYRFIPARIIKQRPLLKDPMAIFSAEWFAKRYNCQVVIVIRHPLAFIGSVKRLKWYFDFNGLLQQKELINGPLYRYKDEIKYQIENSGNIINQAVLLWNIIHNQIIDYQKKYPNWIFILHEHISLFPTTEFKLLFQKLNLDYTDMIDKNVRKYSFSSVREIPDGKVFYLKRNSKCNITSWKKRLTRKEIDYITRKTALVASCFY